ncbi:ectonucleotide pyrophosphatase/phosphodiesterase family member 5 [Nematostella vectensis]|uniref:ectonucleotide pyrophosphatase/phosphodiesterase family member 5 n=1 Tax=Nematostella vectensis TaxID=45351 RepID=UPI00138FB595|nr:ectonucleotide pyrophosphatase/phosphodiesterase family member 5 [Nematostella vectensis]
MKSTILLFPLVFLLTSVLSLALCFSDHPVLLISVDGLGWQKTGDLTPNLNAFGKTGAKAKYQLAGTPTRTWPTHITWLTGLYPESHGLISDHFWDPVYQENFTLQYDCSNYDTKFYNATEPLWLTVQKRGGKSGVYFWPASHAYHEKPTYTEPPFCLVDCSKIKPKDLPKYREKTRKEYPPYIHCFNNRSIAFKDRVDTVLSWLTSEDTPKFTAFYINEPDGTGHRLGLDSGDYDRQLVRVDKDVIGRFISGLKKAQLYDQVNTIIVSPHGLVRTSSSRVIYLSDYINTASIMLSEEGVVGHIWPHHGYEDDVYANLTSANHPNMRVYRRNEIPEDLHWRNNRRIPAIYLDTDLGWSVQLNRPNHITPWALANHGWRPSAEYGGVFYAHGPAFKQGYESTQVVKAVDVYSLLCQLLGTEPLPNNGTLKNMIEYLVEGTEWTQEIQTEL